MSAPQVNVGGTGSRTFSRRSSFSTKDGSVRQYPGNPPYAVSRPVTPLSSKSNSSACIVPFHGSSVKANSAKENICDGKTNRAGILDESKCAESSPAVNRIDDVTEKSGDLPLSSVHSNSGDLVKSSSQPMLEDPKLASRRFLQQLKTRKLLDYGIAPQQSPLASPIPQTVRKAFKPPAISCSPSAPILKKNVNRTPKADKETEKQNVRMTGPPDSPPMDNFDDVVVALDGKLTEESVLEDSGKASTSTEKENEIKDAIGKDTSIVVTCACRESTNETLHPVENTLSEKVEHLIGAKSDSQDSTVLSEGGSQASDASCSSKNSNATKKSLRKTRRKRSRTGSDVDNNSSLEVSSPAAKRRSSLRSRKN